MFILIWISDSSRHRVGAKDVAKKEQHGERSSVPQTPPLAVSAGVVEDSLVDTGDRWEEPHSDKPMASCCCGVDITRQEGASSGSWRPSP